MRQGAWLIVFLLVSVAALAQETPAKLWSSSLGAGLALTSGNSDTRNVNLNFNTAWDPKTVRRFKADAVYLRGDSGGETNVDKASAGARTSGWSASAPSGSARSRTCATHSRPSITSSRRSWEAACT